MGIPKFFRWISERYPLISQTITKDTIIPEYDNLYLDFNGIIHRCSHPGSSLDTSLTESDMIIKMFEYVQIIVNQIKPRKALIIAVDGVAPRAKMNQQRSRRFRSSKETEEELEKAKKAGKEISKESLFDSNCITPGTEFMEKLNEHFEYFVRKKICEDENWKNLKVVFSGHTVPGEGEHKIMSFIRKMKSSPDWNPNTSHCMYGLDADLIMLSLVTHEPNFSILRENVLQNPKNNCNDDFQLLHIPILREYLYEEFKTTTEVLGFPFDFERVIDDFVFMCYFIGNDFLPNLPFLDISDFGLDRLFDIYKHNLKDFGNYLTNHGNINYEICKKYLKHVSIIEQEVLNIGGHSQDNKVTFGFAGIESADDSSASTVAGDDSSEDIDPEILAIAEQQELSDLSEGKRAEKLIFKQQIKSLGLSQTNIENQIKQGVKAADAWKSGYYTTKFHQPIENQEFYSKLNFDYLQGLAWVLKYYYNGCRSWAWFYPYHYAPLATDLCEHNAFDGLSDFPPSEPFLPFEQLLSVLPRASQRLLPLPYQILMASTSPIADFYPTNFEIDMNGKKNSWEGVVLIPFIDQVRLKSSIATYINEATLSEVEIMRNRNVPQSTLFYFNLQVNETVPSTLKGLPALPRNHCAKESLTLPESDVDFSLCAGVHMGTFALFGFPTLKSINYQTSIKMMNVSLFRGPCRRESLAIEVNQPKLFNEAFLQLPEEQQKEEMMRITDQLAEKLINKIVYVNYPYHQEARVIEVATKYKLVRKLPNGVIQSAENKGAWAKTIDSLSYDFRVKKGIDLGEIEVVLQVEPIAGMSVSENGALVKYFSNERKFHYPYQVTLFNVVNADRRYEEKPSQPIQVECPLNTTIILKDNKYYGAQGTVVGYSKDSKRIKVQYTPLLNLNTKFVYENHRNFAEVTYNQNDIASTLGIRNAVISQITATLKLQPSGCNIGLCMKNTAKKTKLFGYAEKRDDSNWEFTEKAILIIKEYYENFREVFDFLNNNQYSKTILETQIFPTNTKQRLKQLQQFLKKYDLKSKSHISIYYTCLSANAIIESNKQLDQYKAAKLKYESEHAPEVAFFDRNQLQLPVSDILHTTDSPVIRIGDRVRYIRQSSTPFGSLGVVIAVNSQTLIYTVLFDEEFIGGSIIDGCDSPRILLDVEARYLLNISEFQRSRALSKKNQLNTSTESKPSTPPRRWDVKPASPGGTTNSPKYDKGQKSPYGSSNNNKSPKPDNKYNKSNNNDKPYKVKIMKKQPPTSITVQLKPNPDVAAQAVASKTETTTVVNTVNVPEPAVVATTTSTTTTAVAPSGPAQTSEEQMQKLLSDFQLLNTNSPATGAPNSQQPFPPISHPMMPTPMFPMMHPMQYPPGAFPPMQYPPGGFPPGAFPGGGFPPGAFPAGPVYAPGAFPPAAFPPGFSMIPATYQQNYVPIMTYHNPAGNPTSDAFSAAPSVPTQTPSFSADNTAAPATAPTDASAQTGELNWQQQDLLKRTDLDKEFVPNSKNNNRRGKGSRGGRGRGDKSEKRQ